MRVNEKLTRDCTLDLLCGLQLTLLHPANRRLCEGFTCRDVQLGKLRGRTRYVTKPAICRYKRRCGQTDSLKHRTDSTIMLNLPSSTLDWFHPQGLTYHQHLAEQKEQFFLELISCPLLMYFQQLLHHNSFCCQHFTVDSCSREILIAPTCTLRVWGFKTPGKAVSSSHTDSKCRSGAR